MTIKYEQTRHQVHQYSLEIKNIQSEVMTQQKVNISYEKALNQMKNINKELQLKIGLNEEQKTGNSQRINQLQQEYQQLSQRHTSLEQYLHEKQQKLQKLEETFNIQNEQK